VREKERGWRREMTRGPGWSEEEKVLTRGVLLSAGEQGRGDTLSGPGGSGPWALSEAEPNRYPAALFLFLIFFSIFFFCNLVYFITFVKMLQNTSNQLLNSFKNQLNVLNQ
jgi:hypothetical protein